MHTTAHSTAYSLIRPNAWWLELPLLLGFNLLLVACAYIVFTVPFSPVPITGQTFGVLLVAMALGRVRGTAVVTAYLIEGIAGLPVFAGGSAGPAVLAGPTAGYLLGFVVAAWVVGSLADRGWDKNFGLSVAAMTIGTAVIFIGGLAWLTQFVPLEGLLTAGLIPFAPGALIKIGIASVILPSIWRFIRNDR
ncbi:biotin transporter BioY [candidate division GN15 bacterium]|nr:biotin transporter BioY [candidate division GN15 bacterium]